MCDTGTVLRISGGLCEVLIGDETISCTARGNVRKREEKVCVGDRVRISRAMVVGGDGVVEDVLPRRNCLVRPVIANVDQAVAVTAVRRPDPNLLLLDRVLILVGQAGLDALVCVSKADLAESEAELEVIAHGYELAGYPVVVTSSSEGAGVDELRRHLRGKTSVFSGPSGVGKSALLNSVQPGHALREGEVSRKIGRGRHTTREVRLIPLSCGGFIADAPGFSALDIAPIEPRKLCRFYPEMEPYADKCRFVGCVHDGEPDCAVKDAVALGAVDAGRYERYLVILEELRQAQKRQYR